MSLILRGLVRLGDLTIESDVSVGNEIVAITGANGIGKTSLLKVIAGLLSLESGSLIMDDEVLDDPSKNIFVPAHKRKLGMVSQFDDILPFLNAQDNIAFPLMAAGMDRATSRVQAIEAMEKHGIRALAQMKPTQLSGGQRQRVGLVRGLIGESKIVLLDEPFSMLDELARSEVRFWLRSRLDELPGPKFIVTHDRQDVEQLCDREMALEQRPNQHSGLRSVATTVR
jgi:ABC-type sulfate/molybdate transport systems ATPase subunit